MTTRVGNKTAACVCALLMSAVAWGLSPRLTAPRIGDALTVGQFDQSPAWTDSASMCPDLGSVRISDNIRMKVWPASASDTLSSYVIVRGREIVRIRQHGDTLWMMDRNVPGKIRMFDSMPTYGAPPASYMAQSINTHGDTDNIGAYITSGQWLTTVVPSLTIRTTENEVLRDVECVVTHISETLIYSQTDDAASDTTVYTGRIRNWYAPGYRYPILTHEEGALTSRTGEPLDSVSTWQMITPEEQAENITDDAVNELIRNRYVAQKYTDPDVVRKRASDSGATNDSRIHYDPSHREVVITPVFGDTDGMNAYVLCDLPGRVYSFGDISTGAVNISTEGFTPGVYILHVATSGEPIVYKFIVD